MSEERILIMYFLDGNGDTRTVTLRNIREDLTSDDVLPVMETIIEENVFEFEKFGSKYDLVEVVGAKITTTTTNQIFDDRK